MLDRELFDRMAEAAHQATQAAVAAGYGLGDKVTRDSAFAAAEDVYRRERPEDFAPKPAPPITLPEHVDDPARERMEAAEDRANPD